MGRFKLSIGLIAVAISSLFLVQAHAVHETVMTCCVTSGGEIEKCLLGDGDPRKRCTGGQTLVKFGLKAADTAQQDDISTNAGDISTNAGNISTNTTNISTNAGNIGTNTEEITGVGTGHTNSRIDKAAVEIGNEAVDYEGSRIDDSALRSLQNRLEILLGQSYEVEPGVLDNTQIDQNQANANLASVPWIDGILENDGGGISEAIENVPTHPTFWRTLNWHPGTGELALAGEVHHGLDISPGNNTYWWCNIGHKLMNGQVQVEVQKKADDVAIIHSAVCGPGNEGCDIGDSAFASHRIGDFWFFKFENNQGKNGTSPFPRILIGKAENDGKSASEYVYEEIEPELTGCPHGPHCFPVTGWIYGHRYKGGFDTTENFNKPHLHADRINIAISRRELDNLIDHLNQEHGRNILNTNDRNYDDFVAVDLSYAVANTIYDPSGVQRDRIFGAPNWGPGSASSLNRTSLP